jgi:hypothetical protein
VLDLKSDDVAQKQLQSVLREELADIEWPPGDAPTAAFGRAFASGNEDDPHLVVEFVLRHDIAGEGLAITERAVQAGIEQLTKLPQARLFRPLLEQIANERRGTDATWRLDVGRARDAAGVVVMLAPFLFLAGSDAAPAVQAPPLQVRELQPKPGEQPRPGEKPKPGGDS